MHYWAKCKRFFLRSRWKTRASQEVQLPESRAPRGVFKSPRRLFRWLHEPHTSSADSQHRHKCAMDGDIRENASHAVTEMNGWIGTRWERRLRLQSVLHANCTLHVYGLITHRGDVAAHCFLLCTCTSVLTVTVSTETIYILRT